MSDKDLIRPADLRRTPHIPHDDAGPVFNAPWEAKAFAMTVGLHRQGIFTWTEWCEALGAEIKAAQEAGDPDLGDTYYTHWLNALERLIQQKKVASADTLLAVKEDWRAADHHRDFGEAPVYVAGAGSGET
ncbi:MAG: nitrile hydratase accessory protein [Pseudomonadota bacterium]